MRKKTSDAINQPVSEPTRRNPTQRRSRERQERILAVATQLIAAKGSDQLKMSEIAERSEISIGSLYQYFPDKSSVIRTLAERYNAESRRCIEEALGAVEPHTIALLFGITYVVTNLAADLIALLLNPRLRTYRT